MLKECATIYLILSHPFVDSRVAHLDSLTFHLARYLLGRPLVNPYMLQALKFDLGADDGISGYALLSLHSHLMGIMGIAPAFITIAFQLPVNR